MALGTSNITPRLANAEMGNPIGVSPYNDLTVKQVCGYASQKQYSFYGPWELGVNATTKCIEIQYGTNNYRLGDFRGYNHSAATPAPATSFTKYWGPTGTTVDIGITSLLGEMNVLEADSNATYITYNAYLTTANRTSEINRHDQDINSAQFNTVTPPTGHIRTSTSKIHGTHVDTFAGMSTSLLSTPTDYIYLDTFFSNSSGTRLVTIGGSVAGGYTTITMYQNQNPTLSGGANYTPPPGTYTAIWPAIHSASTPRCTDGTLSQTNGGTTYSFYLSMSGIDGVTSKNRAVTSCTVSLKVGGSSAVIKTSQALGSSSKTLISGTIPGTLSGGNFSYNEVWTVEVSSITWSATETNC